MSVFFEEKDQYDILQDLSVIRNLLATKPTDSNCKIIFEMHNTFIDYYNKFNDDCEAFNNQFLKDNEFKRHSFNEYTKIRMYFDRIGLYYR